MIGVRRASIGAKRSHPPRVTIDSWAPCSTHSPLGGGAMAKAPLVSIRRVAQGTAALVSIALVSTMSTISLAAPAGASAADTTCGAPAKATSSELSSTTGITKTSVQVGNVSIISGPVPGLFQGAPYGAEAYFAYVNAHGGVNGRTINLHSMDDGFSGTQNEAETQSAAASDFATVGSFSLFDNYSCSVIAKNPALADVSATLDPTTNALPNVFSAQPISQGAPLAGYEYLKKLYPKAIGHVGTLVADATTALAQWQGQEAAMKHAGYRFSYIREISPLESDFTTDVINMKNKGVKMVLVSDDTAASYAALQAEMTQQGFHPQVVLSNGPIYTPTYVTAAGGPTSANGTWLIQDLALYLGQDAKAVPAVAQFDAWMKKTHPKFVPDLYSVFGWASAEMFTQALRAAGPHPTRGSLLTQLRKITSFDAGGLVAPANPAKKLPPNCVLFSRILNAKFTRVAPTPHRGWDCSQPYYSIHGPLKKVNPPSS